MSTHDDWNPLLEPGIFDPARWCDEASELRDSFLLAPSLAAARRVFSPEWAADYGIPWQEEEGSSRAHPALPDSVVRGNRWKLLLAGAAVHRFRVSDETIDKLREAPTHDNRGNRHTRYEDTIAELTAGLLVQELGFDAEHEPNTEGFSVLDWIGRCGDLRVLFESKRSKASARSNAQMQATIAFHMKLQKELPDDAGRLRIELGPEFDRATRIHGYVRREVAEELATRAARTLPPADGVRRVVDDGIIIERHRQARPHLEWCLPPPVDYVAESAGVLGCIDKAATQIKKSGLPGVIIVAPEETILAEHYVDSIREHVATKGDYLVGVLVVLSAPPHLRVHLFPGAASRLLDAALRTSAIRPCSCGAAHVDLLTKPEACEIAAIRAGGA